MGKKLYVGNLPYSVRDNTLADAFAPFGTVESAKVMMERDSDRSKGFGFVEMGSDAEAQAAIDGMNGNALEGRNLVVNEARPMTPRAPRSGFGGGRSGGYNSGPRGGFGGGRGGDRDGGDSGFRSPYGGQRRGGHNDRGGYHGGNDRGGYHDDGGDY